MAVDPFDQFLGLYRNDWVGMARDVFGYVLDEHQAAILTDIQRGERYVAVRSGHGVGKTLTLSCAIACHALTRFPQKTVCTAPNAPQLFDALAAETKAIFRKLPPALAQLFDIKSEAIVHLTAPEESFVSFRTSRADVPEAMAGVHSDNVLLIVDEASGVPNAIFTAASGSMSSVGAKMVMAGNPVRTEGRFFDAFHTLAHLGKTYHISCIGHPRITPDFIAEKVAEYGEGTNDYRVRVLGEFPLAEKDAIIPYDLLQNAIARDVEPTISRAIWGVDVARQGDDRSVLVSRRGNIVEGREEWKHLDNMQLAGRIKARWDSTTLLDRPTAICVDAIGFGAGVADRLRELGLPALAINVAESPAFGDTYLNLKAELWFKARDWFEQRACSLRGDAVLAAELGWAKKDYTSAGKTKVEGKKDVRKRTKKSPDIADAFIMTFAADAGSALFGSASGASWNEPLTRELRCLA